MCESKFILIWIKDWLNLMNTQLQKLNSLDRRVGKVTSTEQIPIANEIKKRASNVSRETSKRWSV